MTRRPSAKLAPGVLAKHQVEELLRQNRVSYPKESPPGQIDGSAFDLTLGTRAWRLAEGLRPTTRELDKIRRGADEHHLKTDDRTGRQYFEFQARQIYLVELQEWLSLPPNICGRATGKSTIGRLDAITRLLTTEAREYDMVRGGYEGNLYLLFSPLTFDIQVAPGRSLNQLRLFCGPQHAAVVERQMIEHYGRPFWYVVKSDDRSEYENWEEVIHPTGGRGYHAGNLTADPHLFDLTVDLGDPDCPFVYRAKRASEGESVPPIDYQAADHDPKLYFEQEPILRDGDDRYVKLDTNSFYIMKSRERLSIPTDVAVEVIAISERIGDIRIHYAGFAHPGFGTKRADERKGTPLIFEVRATDMQTKLFDGSILAKIQLFRMSESYQGDAEPTVYESQELQLSKVFAKWE